MSESPKPADALRTLPERAFRARSRLVAGVFCLVCFGLAVLFSLVTLPVEYDASERAKKLMVSSGIVSGDEAKGASEVLSAAFLTYVAAAVTALLTLLYYLYRSGLLSRRD